MIDQVSKVKEKHCCKLTTSEWALFDQFSNIVKLFNTEEELDSFIFFELVEVDS